MSNRGEARVPIELMGSAGQVHVESGDYEIADNLLDASHQLRGRRPEAARHGARVGYPAAFRIGWGNVRKNERFAVILKVKYIT